MPDYTGDIIASDNCDANLDVAQNPVAGSTISGTTNAVTLTVTDDAGNSSEVSFNVVVVDNTKPVITSTHNEQTLAVDGNCEASLPDYTGDIIASDNCDANLDVVQNPVAGTTVSGATNTVTLTVTDDAGNFSEVSFNVLVEDNTKPVITSTHNEQTIVVDGNCEALLPDYTGDIMASDNCDASLAFTQSPVAGTSISGATNDVTLTVTDDDGNYSNISFNVAVADNTKPTISCAASQTVYADETHSYTVNGTEFDPTETNDNCGVASITNDLNNASSLANTQLPEGTTTITWTVTDNAGNTENCSFDITVNVYATGIKTLQEEGILIYPNPTSEKINFEFANYNIQKLIISDMSGKTLIEKTEIKTKETIDLSSLKNGFYIINIHTDNDVISTKIIKE